MQLTTDGFEAYKIAVPRIIGKKVDFAQQVKRYANTGDSVLERRYSPSQCVGVRTHIRRGNPNPDLISTSHMERTNLTVRLFNRRFTRLTLGYSKKFEYLIHSINLMVFYYNFVWVHSAHGQTPAIAAGLTGKVWVVCD
jgi:IS1 family transposase